ncbi:hypothetical protein DID74_01395 [Candidatus Marinamargulisbacteria bacterium SCGC AG-333-B06]|nr:hypothetical protein DID74_01395 [Candidatus Marinamargulisbacteria bacterium SCGC AG-333-B06]
MSHPVTAVIDIGGTKLAYGLLTGDDECYPTILYQNVVPFNKGMAALQQRIRNICHDIKIWAHHNNLSIKPTIIVGSAGNFKPNTAIILPGTAINLGKTPQEFDNIDLNNIIRKASDNQFKCLVCNDAMLQLAGGVTFSQQDNIDLLAKKIAYIGPGTGLGGAFATVTTSGLSVVTDGHIFDMKLKDPFDKPVMAEDVFSGRGFYQQHKITLKEINQSQELLKKYQIEIKQLGHYLGQIMIQIYQGKFEKLSQYPWEKQDYNAIKQTDHFILGGSIGSKGLIADQLKDIAQAQFYKTLNRHPLIYKIPDTEKAALIGGFVLAENYGLPNR